MAAYLVTPLPTPKYPIDVSGGATFAMDGNGPDPTLTVNGGNPCGDCGFAGMSHKRTADAACGHEASFVPDTSDEVVTEYLAFDNGQDQGVVVSAMMNAWFSSGFFGQKIAGYVPIRVSDIDAALGVFGAIICGVNLTDDADQLFSEGLPWTVANGEVPDPNEGHVIVKVRSTVDEDTYVTWGALQPATKEWSAACIEEAWGVVDSQMAANAQMNLTALLNDIRSIGGGQVQAPAPVSNGAPPAPGPVVAIEDAIEHEAETVIHDVEQFAEDEIAKIEHKLP